MAANSSAENSDLNFEAYTDRIPPKEMVVALWITVPYARLIPIIAKVPTPVTIELIPVAAPLDKATPRSAVKKKTGSE